MTVKRTITGKLIYVNDFKLFLNAFLNTSKLFCNSENTGNVT